MSQQNHHWLGGLPGVHARNIRAWCSPICVLGPPGSDFADSAAVARNLLLNSLSHLYITMCIFDETGSCHLLNFPKQGRKTIVSVSVSSNMIVLCIPMPSDLKSEHPQGVLFRKGQELRTSRMRRIAWNVRNEINV